MICVKTLVGDGNMSDKVVTLQKQACAVTNATALPFPHTKIRDQNQKIVSNHKSTSNLLHLLREIWG